MIDTWRKLEGTTNMNYDRHVKKAEGDNKYEI